MKDGFSAAVMPKDTINITLEELEEIINILDTYTKKIKDSWGTSVKSAMNTLASSWAGTACEKYISNIRGMDSHVQNTLAALELLSNTYKTARDKTLEVKNTVKQSIYEM